MIRGGIESSSNRVSGEKKMGCLGIIVSFIVVALFSVIPFLIHPLLGVVWVLWLIGVAIYTIKFKKK